MDEEQLVLSRIYRVNSKNATVECLSNDSKLKGNCDNIINDPKYSFLLSSIKKDNIIAISPFEGKCLGQIKDGKTIYVDECLANSIKYKYIGDANIKVKYKDEEEQTRYVIGSLLSSEDGTQIIIEELPSINIFWNYKFLNKFLDKERLLLNSRENLKNLISSTKGSIEQKIVDYNVSSDSKYHGEFKDDVIIMNDEGMQNIFNHLIYNSVLNYDINRSYFWTYNSNPKVLIICGPSGIGKTKFLTPLSVSHNLKDPFLISDDIPVEGHPFFKILKGIYYNDNEGQIRLPKLHDIFSQYIKLFEEKKRKFILDKKSDHIIEKGDININRELIIDYDNHGYNIYIYFLYTRNKYRLSRNRTNRFNEVGRYGASNYIRKEKMEKLKNQIEAMGKNVSIKIINVDTIPP